MICILNLSILLFESKFHNIMYVLWSCGLFKSSLKTKFFFYFVCLSLEETLQCLRKKE